MATPVKTIKAFYFAFSFGFFSYFIGVCPPLL